MKNPAAPDTKTTYKDYQKFLQTYNDNKSDRALSPTTLSTNSSSSSVPSTICETDNVPVAFNEYLQTYNSKKFNTVKPNLPKKNVKTEIFVQVNQDDETDNLFGRRYNTLKSRKTPGKVILTRNNSLNKRDVAKGPLSPAGHQICLSPPPAKQEVVPDAMIYAKTAVLNELCTNPPRLVKSPSPPLKSPTEVSNVINTFTPPPPPPMLPDFTNNPPPSCLIVKKTTSETASQPKPAQHGQKIPDFISEMQNRFKESSHSGHPTFGLVHNDVAPHHGSQVILVVPEAPVPSKSTVPNSKTSEILVNISSNGQQNGRKSPVIISSSLPPPLPSQKFIKQEKTAVIAQNQNGAYNGQNTWRKSPPPTSASIPPPPKFLLRPKIFEEGPGTTTFVPVSGETKADVKDRTNSHKIAQNSLRKSPPPNSTVIPPAPKFLLQPKTLDEDPVTTTYIPVPENTTNVDKTDPNVKKLVYNTYRGLLGAYNTKANTMVTMPKNRVVQDQGVAKQLESIELQGCLDKLNGRVNPSGENE